MPVSLPVSMPRSRLVQLALAAVLIAVGATSSVAIASSSPNPNPAGAPAFDAAKATAADGVRQDLFTPIQPCRVVKTAAAAPLTTATTTYFVSGTVSFPSQGGQTGGCGIPTDATAITGTVTSSGSVATGGLVLFPAGSAAPTTTTLKFTKGVATSTGFTVKVKPGTARQLAAQATAKTGLTVDVTGFYRPQIYGTFTADGALYHGNGTLKFYSHTSTGYYVLEADRVITGCSATASSYYYAYNVSGYADGKFVYLQMTNYNGTQVDYYFQVHVSC